MARSRAGWPKSSETSDTTPGSDERLRTQRRSRSQNRARISERTSHVTRPLVGSDLASKESTTTGHDIALRDTGRQRQGQQRREPGRWRTGCSGRPRAARRGGAPPTAPTSRRASSAGCGVHGRRRGGQHVAFRRPHDNTRCRCASGSSIIVCDSFQNALISESLSSP